MKLSKKIVSIGLTTSTLFTLVACGGGGGGSPSPTTKLPPGGSGVGPYAAYTNIGMYVVDEGDTEFKKYAITTSEVIMSERLRSEDYDAATQTVSFTRNDDAVVFVSEGRLWRVDLRKGSNLARTQISSASMLEVCSDNSELKTGHVPVSLGGSKYKIVPGWVAWETAGPDQDCYKTADNRRYYTGWNAGAGTSPIDITDKVDDLNLWKDIVNASNPRKEDIEYLAIKGKKLIRYNTQWENPQVIATANNSISLWEETSSLKGVWVRKDDDLRHYQWQASALTDARFTASSNAVIQDSLCAAVCFIIVSDPGGKAMIYRMPADGSASAEKMVADAGLIGTVGTTYYDLSLEGITQKYLYYSSSSSPQNGSHTETLNRVALAPNSNPEENLDTGKILYGVISTSQRFFYGVYNDKFVPRAVILSDDEQPTVYDDSLFSGLVFDNTFALGNGGFFPEIKSLVLIINATDADKLLAGPVLEAVDPETKSTIALGSLPVGFSGFVWGYANELVINAYFSNGVPGKSQVDLYFVNVNQADSIKAITNTDSESEVLVDF